MILLQTDAQVYDERYNTELNSFLNFIDRGWSNRDKPFETWTVIRRPVCNERIEELVSDGKLPIRGNVIIDSDVINPGRHTDNEDHRLKSEEWLHIIESLNDNTFKAVAICNGNKDSHVLFMPFRHHNGKPMAVVVKQLYDKKGKHKGEIITAYGWTENDATQFLYGKIDDIRKIKENFGLENAQVNPVPNFQNSLSAGKDTDNSGTTSK